MLNTTTPRIFKPFRIQHSPFCESFYQTPLPASNPFFPFSLSPQWTKSPDDFETINNLL